MHAAMHGLQVISWFVDRYIHIRSKARFIMPKHGTEGVHGLSTLDVQRAKMVGKIPGRLNPDRAGGLSRVVRRGGDHELAEHVQRDDAQRGSELQPLLGKGE
jgi:hypothetical protein